MSEEKRNAEPGRVKLAEVNARIQAALSLLDTDKADEIIGKPGPEHKVLVQGVEAAIQLLWAGMQNCGARKSKKALGFTAKTQIILLQIVHFAYALGIKRGREQGLAVGRGYHETYHD